MATKRVLTSQVYISVRGTELSPTVMKKLAEVVVDQHTHLPDMFMLRFYDPGLELLDEAPFDLTATVEITAETVTHEKVRLISGEITALEPVFEEGMIAEVVLRGYDVSHRLFREIKSAAFLNKKDSDLAVEIARRAGLQPEVEPTKTVYEHIFQDNRSDLAFLRQRAWRIGYECFVDDGKLFFRRPLKGDASLSLTWGSDLQTFTPRLTLAEQVDEVWVKGWDPDRPTASAKAPHEPKRTEARRSSELEFGAFGFESYPRTSG